MKVPHCHEKNCQVLFIKATPSAHHEILKQHQKKKLMEIKSFAYWTAKVKVY